jgi:hypothetical protein
MSFIGTNNLGVGKNDCKGKLVKACALGGLFNPHSKESYALIKSA